MVRNKANLVYKYYQFLEFYFISYPRKIASSGIHSYKNIPLLDSFFLVSFGIKFHSFGMLSRKHSGTLCLLRFVSQFLPEFITDIICCTMSLTASVSASRKHRMMASSDSMHVETLKSDSILQLAESDNIWCLIQLGMQFLYNLV